MHRAHCAHCVTYEEICYPCAHVWVLGVIIILLPL